MNIFSFIEDSLDMFYIQPDTVICSEKDKVLRVDAEDGSCMWHKSGVTIEAHEITSYKFYVPDEVKQLVAVPFVYVKIERPCKAIKAEFAHRHYSLCGYGVHLVSDDVDEGSVLDNSIFLSPITQIVRGTASGPYEGFESFDAAIERVSRHISLRTGDLVTLDLPHIAELNLKEGSSQTINYQELSITVIA